MRSVRQLMLALVAFAAGSSVATAGTLTVYSALESDEIAVYLDAAHKAMPDIDVHVLRLSTGDLAARLVAESAAPRTDVVWGEAATDLLDPRIRALLAPVSTPNIDRLPSRFRSTDGSWFAATGYMAAMCVNTQALAEQHLPMPKTWADLANPVYRGQIVMPDPTSSGTGYMMLSALLQGNEQSGIDKSDWPLAGAIAANLAQVTLSGSGPCKLARIGEYPIGVSFAFVAMQSIKQGYPITMVIPGQREGYELEASAMLATTTHAVDAKRFLDWTASAQAAELYRQYKEIVAAPGTRPTAEQMKAGLPVDIERYLAPRDFALGASERTATLARWKQLAR
jgi:iron(III) transport system substrate-binding protein